MRKSNWFTKRILPAVLAALAIAICLRIASNRSTVSGANLNPTQQGGFLDLIQRQRLAIVGSWNVPDPMGVPSLYTFHSDGTMIESDVDHTFTAGHGVWMHLGGTQFAYTFVQHKKDDQDQVGSVVVYGNVNLDSTGMRFSGPLHFEFKDTTGKVDTDAALGLDIRIDGERIQIRQ